MMFRWRRMRRIQVLDARVANAEAEAALSRRRLEHAREKVVRPLEARGTRNQFADLIRDSLQPHDPRHDSRA
jgi:hypothetical protein